MSLANGLKEKIRVYVQEYSESLTDTPKHAPISRIKAYSYIQDHDKTLARKKKVQMEKLIDVVCRDIEARLFPKAQDNPPIEIEDEEDQQEVTSNEEQVISSLAETTSKRKDRQTVRESRPKRVKLEDSREPPKNTALKDLGGVENCIKAVRKMIVMPLMHPELFTHMGADIPRGVLLHGPPGCGKTLLANALAGEMGVPFISISAPSIVSGMSGESEKKLREIFEEAKELAPCLMFIDEIDAITPKRENAQREMERRIVAQLLTCMDDLSLGKTGGKPVMIIGATNRPDSIDPALRRPGRFNKEICMGIPNEESRERILEAICRPLRLSDDLDFKVLAKMTPGFVGADLNCLAIEATVVAIERAFQTITKKRKFLNLSDDDGMALDNVEQVGTSGEAELSGEPKSNPDSSILDAYPGTMSEDELAPFSVQYDDFLVALPEIQPASKREGFTSVPDVTWADIGALRTIRSELQWAIVQPIKRPDFFKRVGIVAPSGVLLWGPPGCGKTLLAKAVANESRANFISIRGPELLNKYVGESERAVRQVFGRARACAPCVIFFDELDALVPRRDDSLSESSARVVITMLGELDGLGDRQGVFVIAATNRPDMIDSAMMRPGRLDKLLFVELPTADERTEILRALTKTTPVDKSVNLPQIAEDDRCKNFSGADLSNLVREAGVSALKETIFRDEQSDAPSHTSEDLIPITQQDFEIAFEKVSASVSDMERRKFEKLRKDYSSSRH